MPKQFNCSLCKKRCKPKERRHVSSALRPLLEKKQKHTSTEHDVICNKCKNILYSEFLKKNKKDGVTFNPEVEPDNHQNTDPVYEPSAVKISKTTLSSPPSVSLPIPSAPSTHSRCIFCKRHGPKLIVIPHDLRFWIFIEKNIIIRAGSRCCPVHLNEEGHIDLELIKDINLKDTSFLNRSSIHQLVQNLRLQYIQKTDNSINFDDINEQDCYRLIGLHKAQFEDFCWHITDKVKSTSTRSHRLSIGLFLMKIKCAISNCLLATLFRLSKSSVRRAIATVRKALMRSFVPLYLGFEAITREDIIDKHTRPLAKTLFDASDNTVILVLDGTYIYIQKSNNFRFQRSSFSLHKSRPLVKPMVVVTTTGHFVSIIGPYLAKNNDASILNHLLQTNVEDIKSFLKDDDLLIVDRGFRDSVALLENMGIRAAMPTFMKKGEKQMSTEDANASRLVTKIRWVVESANARIKRFRYLDRVLPTSQVPYIGDYVKIVCAISNKYFPALSSPTLDSKDHELAKHMKQLSTEVNTLKLHIEANKLDRRTSQWTPLSKSELTDFPALTDDQLRSLTCGVYQMKLGPSYIQEYMEGDSDICVNIQDDHLLCVRMQSRHVSSKKYMLWIKYCDSSILSWYCKCRAGSRVVGVCSHIAAIIWYLSKARHESGPGHIYGIKNWGQHLEDASILPENIDSSDSESDVSSNIEE